jgi:hypothetical protein
VNYGGFMLVRLEIITFIVDAWLFGSATGWRGEL